MLCRLLAGELRMVEGLLEAPAALFPEAAMVGDLADRVPDVNEACMIVRLLEQGQGRVGKRIELVDHRVRVELDEVTCGDETREGFAGRVAGCGCLLGRTLG